MSRRIGIFEVVHAVLMSFWLGAAVLAGVAAAIVFPAMRGLDPRLPGYPGYTGEHWLIAGGKVMAPVFAFAGGVQLACVIGAMIAFIFSRGPRRGAIDRRVYAVRAAVLVLLVGITAYQSAVLRPRMMGNMRAHWQSAGSGDNAGAIAAKAAFDADHGLSNTVLASAVSLGLVSLALTVLSAGRLRNPEAPA